ncbi:MAG: DEAD/DEAH box helicase [Methanobacteriaceae archaeon]|nr:DEAD/DEAH box helicase [Methanobacteriaceae archaeon]
MVNYIDHPLIPKDKVEARIYQQVLAANVLTKGNSMIVAPTALGKTIIAVLVAAERLKNEKGSKILVLSPSKPLAIQHEESFKEFLNVPCSSITGSVKISDREKRWAESQVISATPQTVESDLLNGRYTLENVSLIVFDECHHGVGAYSYVYLASRYVKECQKHLILALTASPGSDRAKIKEVCDNLFIQDVVVKSEDDADVKPYFNPIKIDWVKIDLDKELEEIRDLLNKALKVRLKGLKQMGVINTISVNKRDVLQARGRIQNRIARSVNPPKDCYRAMSIITAVINVQHALELLETQGVSPFNRYIERLKKKTTRAAKNLRLDPNFSKAIALAIKAEEKGLEHPKLNKLTELLKKELGAEDKEQTRLSSLRTGAEGDKNKDTPKIIVFTQFRDTLDIIHQKCEKEGIKSVKFYGQGTRDGEKGLTQKKQREIIKSFKTGNYDVLLSTSVAEEGIDIPAVDLVILYEPVPSEVRMIQRRGRTGRKSTGRMKVLITKGTRDEAYYWSSVNKERKMKRQLDTKAAIEGLELNAADRIESERSIKTLGKKESIIIDDDNPANNNSNISKKQESINESISDLNDDLEEEITSETNHSEYSDEELEEGLNVNAVSIKDEIAKSDKIVVYADSREGNSKVLRALDTIGVDIKIKAMTVADYQITEEVAIERKTAKDFVDSIVDKRLFKQARMMMEEFKKPIMILEGDDFYSGFINPDAIRGSIASIALDFGISIIPTRNQEDTAAMIKRIAIREQKGEKRSISIRTEKKPQNLWEQQLFIIESLPNIGPVNAKNLLSHFGSVEAIMNADEKQLQEVDGIGKKTSENIRKVIESKYLEFTTDKSQSKL